MFCTSFKTEITLPVLQFETKNNFHVHDLYKTRKSTKNESSNFGLIEETIYRKVTSSRLSWLVAHLGIFRLFIEGKFDAYVL